MKGLDKNIAIVVTKDKKVFLNFDKPVGKLMVEKIAEILDLLDDVSKDK